MADQDRRTVPIRTGFSKSPSYTQSQIIPYTSSNQCAGFRSGFGDSDNNMNTGYGVYADLHHDSSSQYAAGFYEYDDVVQRSGGGGFGLSPNPNPNPKVSKCKSMPSWRNKLDDPELKRKKRIASYKAYSTEGKVKSSIRSSIRWLKGKCLEIRYGWYL